MKHLIFTILLLGLLIPSISAQSARFQQINQRAELAKQNILDILKTSPLEDEFVICQQLFNWDTMSNQFKVLGDGTISYEDLGEVKKFSIKITTMEGGQESDIKIITYTSFQDISQFQNNLVPDSLLLYLGDGMDNYELFSRDINYFEDERLVFSESFTDYNVIDVPFGYLKTRETRYYYDQNNFLIQEATDNYSFGTGMMEFSDSTIYENNDLGLPELETSYHADIFTGQIVPYNQTEYTYINQYYIATEIDKDYIQDEWITMDRTSFEYDNMNRQTMRLKEVSDDNGTNWEMDRRTQSLFEDDLPLGFPSRDLSQEYIDGNWRNESLTVNEDCTSGLQQTTDIALTLWFDQDILNIDHSLVGPGQVAVYDLNGRIIFLSDYDQIPNQIQLSGLNHGIYIVELQQGIQRITEKLFK